MQGYPPPYQHPPYGYPPPAPPPKKGTSPIVAIGGAVLLFACCVGVFASRRTDKSAPASATSAKPSLPRSPIPYREYGTWVNDRPGSGPLRVDVRIIIVDERPKDHASFVTLARRLHAEAPKVRQEIFTDQASAAMYAAALREGPKSQAQIEDLLMGEDDADPIEQSLIGSIDPTLDSSWQFLDLVTAGAPSEKL